MPKAQVLVTLSAEALVDVPEGVEDVESYCREHVGLSWGELRVDSLVQTPSVMVDYFIVAEQEAEPSPEAEAPIALAAPVVDEETATETPYGLGELLDDPALDELVRAAVRERATRLLEEVVAQVVTELEPLLERHLSRNPRKAS